MMDKNEKPSRVGRWLWMPIAIMVVGVPLASSALPVLPFTFASGEPIVATEINANFDHLQASMEALAAGGNYCSSTAETAGRVTAAGGLVGYTAAASLCQSACSSPSAHICSAEEVGRNAQRGVEMPRGWYSSVTGADCYGWTRTDITSNYWTGENGMAVTCTTLMPILCCD